MTQNRITELSTQLASSIAGKEPQDVLNLCQTFIELAVKESTSNTPDKISFHYMHDNHLFQSLTGTLEEVLVKARKCAEESPYGMLCDAILTKGNEEVRRIGGNVHATKTLGDTANWESAVRNDPDAMRLLQLGTNR